MLGENDDVLLVNLSCFKNWFRCSLQLHVVNIQFWDTVNFQFKANIFLV